MPYRRTGTTRGRKRFGGTSRKYSTKRSKGIYSKRRKARSNNAVRKIARKAAKNVLKDKRPLLHRRFNLDANANGTKNLVHNQWQLYFTYPHSVGDPYSGGLAELAGQGASTYPKAPQYGTMDNITTRLIPLCEEPGAVPGPFRTHKWIEDGYIHGQFTFTGFRDRCRGKVRIMLIKYKPVNIVAAVVQDDLIMQTNCVSTGVLPAQNLFDAPRRPASYRTKTMQILKDWRIDLEAKTGGALYGVAMADEYPPVLTQVGGEKIVKFSIKMDKKFYYNAIDKMTFNPETCTPEKWNYGFALCGYGGNGVPAGTNICSFTYKGDMTFRNPI